MDKKDQEVQSDVWYVEAEKTCSHCSESNNLHDYNGEKLCEQHLQEKLARQM